MKITIDIDPKEISNLAKSFQNQLSKMLSDAVTNVLTQELNAETPKNINYELNYNKKNQSEKQNELRIFEDLKKKIPEVLSEYCTDSENPDKKQENNDVISEEGFAKIVDRLYEMVHKPISILSDTTTSRKTERTFPDVKISEYAAVFDL